MDVVKASFHRCVVDSDYREFQFTVICHCPQAVDTGCRLLTSAGDIVELFSAFGVETVD